MIQAQISGLKKSFGKNEILKNVGLTINKGEVVCIIGPSGSGKTTFLRCLNLLERPDAGMYELGDLRYDLSRIGSHQSREIARKTAMVFQSYELFSHMTVLQNVMEGLVTPRKVPKKLAETIATSVLRKSWDGGQSRDVSDSTIRWAAATGRNCPCDGVISRTVVIR